MDILIAYMIRADIGMILYIVGCIVWLIANRE